MLLFLLNLITGDDELVEQCKKGDVKALETIIESWQSKIYSFAYRMLKNEDDAIDITQDVFVKFYNSVSTFKGKCSLKTWLLRITSNEVKNFWRSKMTKRSQVTYSIYEDADNDDPQVLEIKDDSVSPRETAEQNELIANLEKQMNLLKPESREILLLSFKEQLSYEEIAKVLDLNLGTVKSRLARAREELKAGMEKYLP